METLEMKGEKVRESTSHSINQEMDNEIRQRIEDYAGLGHEAIEARIKELDQEWDIERTLETNGAILALAGTLLGAFVNKKWLALPVVVTGFLTQHAIQGWCPPLALFRKMGIRTRPEIDREKYALKALRGDFADVREPSHAWVAVNK